jgi:hypothetical protein
VPLCSRSERVVRAARTARGIGVRVCGEAQAEPKLGYVVHAQDERIVRDAERRLWKIGPSRLPVSVMRDAGRDELLPWIARQDENGVAGALRVSVGAPRRSERVVVTACAWTLERFPSLHGAFAMGDARTAFALPRLAFEVALSPELRTSDTSVALELDAGARIDQIVLASAEPIGAIAPLAVRERSSGAALLRGRAPRGGVGPSWPIVDVAPSASDGPLVRELWFENPPDPGADKTVTLIVEIAADGARRASEPRETVEPTTRALFRDVASEAGIDFVHMEGPDLELDIRPTMGPGAAWGDIDGDGWNDLFLPQGGGRDGSNVPASRMYRNKHDGTFEDVSESSGLALRGLGMGALFFDADGDGDLDLYVANYGANRFLVNDGGGHFTDASAEVGLSGDSWHAAVIAADVDGDGDLDLYVTSYLHYDEAQMPSADDLGKYQREDPIAMLPYAFPGERKTFLRNERARTIEASAKEPKTLVRFIDATDELGLGDKDGRGMQAIFWDFDRDGDQDLYLANDVSPNRFWRNEGHGKWKDIGFATGTDDPRGSMGLAVGDVDGDGDEDLFVTNWQLESNALYVNNLLSHTSAKSRVATFRDNAVQAGLGQLSVGVTKWGCELADFDLDGDLDLYYANGYTSPDYESTGICVGQPCHYFENDGEGHFTPAFEKAGPDVALPLAARCALACDYDQDGDLDLVVTANNGRVRLLRNELEHDKRHWLGVRLRGRNGNTFAIGAEVTLEIGAKKLRRSLRAGTSYLGGNAPELHFGLGESAKIDACSVRWPDGKETKHAIAKTDAFVTLVEPE